MKGTIRFFLGVVLAVSAAGTATSVPGASLLVQAAIGVVGLALAYSGATRLTSCAKSV